MAKKFYSEKMFTKKKFLDSMAIIKEGIKKYPWTFFAVLVTLTIDSVLFASTTLIINKMTNALTNPGQISLTWQEWMYIGIGLFILLIVFEYLINYYQGVFAKKMEVYLRIKALEKLVKTDISYYSKNQIGLIMSRIINDSQGVGDSFNEFLLNFVYIIATFFAMLGLMYTIDSILASIVLAIFLVMIIVIWVVFIFYRRAIIISVDVKQSIDADITDRLINYRLIKSNASENYETKRNMALHKKYDQKLTKVIRWQSSLTLFTSTVAWSLPTMIIIIAAIIYGDKSAQDFGVLMVTFSSACYNILYCLLSLPVCMRGLTKLSNCVMRLNFIYRSEDKIDFKSTGIEINSIESIEFKYIRFIYPESPDKVIIDNLNFKFEKGKSYAFVGETGVGKSTIAKMLLRFYDVNKGQVLVNGINIKELLLASYLKHVGYVEQEPQILFGTIKDNIRYANFSATDEQIIEAAVKAKLDSYIRTLPQGYDTIIGERGFMLSGGQKQRLTIARLFLKNPDLLILDEATSALDNIVEAEIQQELDKLMKNRTTIVIAHRLSTIKNVDHIIVLDKQGIIQQGTFNQLKEEPGRFQKLYKSGLIN